MNSLIATFGLFPRNTAVLVLRVYQRVISPIYGDVCRYHPSCSSYALHSVQEHGFVLGIFLAMKRLGRCHPWARGGIDDVPRKDLFRYRVTRFGFVIGPRER